MKAGGRVEAVKSFQKSNGRCAYLVVVCQPTCRRFLVYFDLLFDVRRVCVEHPQSRLPIALPLPLLDKVPLDIL
jgi:hypothetical protein